MNSINKFKSYERLYNGIFDDYLATHMVIQISKIDNTVLTINDGYKDDTEFDSTIDDLKTMIEDILMMCRRLREY